MYSKVFTLTIPLALLISSSAGATAVDAPGINLKQAIQLLREKSPDIQLSKKRILQAKAALAQAKAAFWPTLLVGVDYGVTNNSAMAFGSILNQEAFSPTMNFNDVSSTDNLRLRATLNIPIYMGGVRFAQRDAQREAGAASRSQARALALALEYQLARTYYSLHRARAFEKTAAATLVALEENLKVANNRVAAGTLLRQDLLAVQLQLTQAKQQLLRAQNARSLLRQALSRILGVKGKEIQIAAEIQELKVPVRSQAAKRPEISALEANSRAAKAATNASKAGYWPQISAFGSVFFDHGFIENGNKFSYMAGLSLNWKVWDGFATRSRAEHAAINESLLQDQQRKQALAITFEQKEARLQYDNASKRLAVSEEAIRLAEERVKLTRALFKTGLALSTQLIDAETALTSSRLAADEVRASRWIAIAALRKAFGLPQL
jgi:outer membrane protein